MKLTNTLLTLLGSAALVSCQTPGRVLRTETSDVCPTCKIETRTSIVKGVTYDKMVCPGCKIEVFDWNAYENGGPYEEIHVCDQCKNAVGTCKLCRQQ